jgi:hypothetical protein
MILPGIQTGFFIQYSNTIRMITLLVAIFTMAMAIRSFYRMLTASMRRKLGQAAVRFAKKLAAPLVKAVHKVLLPIGIDLTRRGRLGGRDERTFVFDDSEKVKKTKKKLKNELKWVEQTDNSARVRFLFIDYMIRQIRGGYFMKRSMTPAEIGREVALEEDEKPSSPPTIRLATQARWVVRRSPTPWSASFSWSIARRAEARQETIGNARGKLLEGGFPRAPFKNVNTMSPP